MSPVPVSPRRVFGVDFNAADDAGEHIWVCRAHPGSDGIRIESVDPLSRLPGGAVDRDQALRALVEKVGEAPRSAWGFDFPFALPQPVLHTLAPGLAGYDQQLDLLASLADADTMWRRCRESAPDGEPRRRTDIEASTPLSPCNLRIYEQTYYGIVDVIRPLRARPEVAVLPFDRLPQTDAAGSRLPFNRAASGAAPHIYLMEVCPASLLTVLEYGAQGYEGPGDEAAERRRLILGRLIDDGFVRPVPRVLRRRIVDQPEGAGLDAVLAAVGAWRGYRDYDHEQLRADPAYAAEGFVYT